MSTNNLPPIDYLIVGHVTQDLIDDHSWRLGGTVSYAGLTVAALGHQVGVLTSCSADLDLAPLKDLHLTIIPSEFNTTFRNKQTETGRQQLLFHRAQPLTAEMVPEAWRSASIVHLGPVADEVDPQIYTTFSSNLLYLTAQGWFRQVDNAGQVTKRKWHHSEALLQAADAVVLSIEDLDGDETEIERLAEVCSLLVITEGTQGARVFWNGDARHFPAPKVILEDDTGAGDIFSACFFHRLSKTNDPWEAARFAVQIAACSVTRRHLESIPHPQEIYQAQVQVI
jgi:sugar/nucleoside kinase (ribokinase family)